MTTMSFNGVYEGARLSRVAFPLGGIGAGMMCLEGTGALSHCSLRNRPDIFNEPGLFAALAVTSAPSSARVLEGPVPSWKLFGQRGSALGSAGATFGFPRFASARFTARFPFGTVELADPAVPLAVRITGWSPFTPGDADSSSLPVAALEYGFSNPTSEPVDAVFSFNAKNFLAAGPAQPQGVRAVRQGFAIWATGPSERPWEDAALALATDDPAVKINATWFRSGWWDPITMAWRDVAAGNSPERPATEGPWPSPGGSLSVPFRLEPGATKQIVVRLAWYAPRSDLRLGDDPPESGPSSLPGETYRPWYAGQFSDVAAVSDHWGDRYEDLRLRSRRFSDCFYDTTFPPEVVEAVAANLAILKSPTILRQVDGRLWGWEGCNDERGICHGSCTHVWNYAQALPHLFPVLERTLRETEFGPSQDERGHQAFRSALPIRPVVHDFHSAADGQLGGIMKVYREWRISGDTAWLRGLWPQVRQSLDYCITTWDPEHRGWVEEPHHNTYDIEFWGPDGLCTSFYLGALQAAVGMGNAMGEPVATYADLLERGRNRTEHELFDGEYFVQKIIWKTLRAADPTQVKSFGGDYSPEAVALLEKEGPRYQYGSGCLADGVLGAWMAMMCGVGQILPDNQVKSHLRAVYRHNLRRDLSTHVNPQRPGFACGAEGGLLLCTWPKGGALSLPFVYSNEVWTGIEYQVASHLISLGLVEEGREIIRICRARYDGQVRNPFNEYECGHWYARAMASYGLLMALSGARYDAVEEILFLTPPVTGDFRSFLATATGYGTVGVADGKPFFELKSGTVKIRELRYLPAE